MAKYCECSPITENANELYLSDSEILNGNYSLAFRHCRRQVRRSVENFKKMMLLDIAKHNCRWHPTTQNPIAITREYIGWMYLGRAGNREKVDMTHGHRFEIVAIVVAMLLIKVLFLCHREHIMPISLSFIASTKYLAKRWYLRTCIALSLSMSLGPSKTCIHICTMHTRCGAFL